MACKRCGDCDVNYPLSPAYDTCKGCGGFTYGLEHTPPDQDWNARVERARREVWEQNRPKRANVPELPPVHYSYLTEHPPGSGTMWVHRKVLEEAGYSDVWLDDVIKVAGPGGSFIHFEVAGSAGHTRQGRERPGWFLQRIPDASEMFADLPVLDAEPEA